MGEQGNIESRVGKTVDSEPGCFSLYPVSVTYGLCDLRIVTYVLGISVFLIFKTGITMTCED